jgi:hypothetical protein
MRRRSWIAGLAVVGAIGWYLFRPELLFVKTKVNEGLPTPAAAQVAPTAGAETAGAAVLFSGTFHSVAHETHGTATVHHLGNGRRVVRFTDFATSNGPDVRVYLVAAADASDNETVTKAGFIELGKLKGTEGDQNYEIPADLDLAKYRAVTIWCRRFSVNFATAPLTPANDATTFKIRVENISKGEVLSLSNGGTAPFVSAPVLWAIHTGAGNPIFTGGQPESGNGLERLAETGNPEGLVKSLSAASGVLSVGAEAQPIGATSKGPLTPGQAYEFEISARLGQALSLAWMFGQSNDLFYGNDRPIGLFTSEGEPVRGDMTPQLNLWDAGTEVNEEPGLGPNQGPRQKAEDAGTTERNAIAHARDRWSYPKTGAVLRLAITPKGDAVSVK